MNKSVEYFKAEDIGGCVELFYDVYKNIPFRFEWLEKQNVSRYISDTQGAPNFLGFTLYADGKPVGYCLGKTNDYFKNSTYEIDELFIKKTMQGEGLGTFFVAFIEMVLAKKDIKVMKLNTNKTASASEFYGKIGFVPLVESVCLMRKVNAIGVKEDTESAVIAENEPVLENTEADE